MRPDVLTESDITRLTGFRRALHAAPEISGEERETAAAVAGFVSEWRPDRLVTGLGGHGVAAVFAGAEAGPTVLFRAELDALPIVETGDVAHRSQVPGKSHMCGHDGHTATLAAMAIGFGRRRPKCGRAVLMFQPAEETGAGARAVVNDPGFAEIAPDIAFSWHNMPGLPLGQAAIATGPVNCASRGMAIALTGWTSHASEPENGRSPMAALASLMPVLAALSGGRQRDNHFRLVTVTHCRMGEPAFGITPGEAELFATLRTLTDDRMAALVAEAEALARQAAEQAGLDLAIRYQDIFAHVENAPEAVAQLADALKAEGFAVSDRGLPMRASEDFGLFGRKAPAAMAFIGAGENCASLHNPDYDFPDELIPRVAPVMMRVARKLLG